MTNPWWKESVVYQIDLRSFADGDGVGDLRGVIAKLDYLRWLGVDALWLSPFYRTPMADAGGYDVSDYCDVDPRFGTLDDFDRLLDAAHTRGLKVLFDWAPNLNWSEPRGEAAIHDVLKFWLARGVDGFRAMVPSDYESAHPRLQRLRELLDSYDGERMMVGEVFLLRPELGERMAQALQALEPIGAWPIFRTRASIGEHEARAAAVLTLTLRGTPFLGMDEELGPEGVAAQQTDLQSILWLYRRLLDARRESPALRSGSQRVLEAPSGVLAWSRQAPGDACEVWINFEDRAIEIRARGEVLVSSQSLGEGEAFCGTLAPHEAVVLGPLT